MLGSMVLIIERAFIYKYFKEKKMKKMNWILGTSALALVAACALSGVVCANDAAKKDEKVSAENMDLIEKGRWEQLKGQVQKEWGKVTDDDWQKLKGSARELTGLLVEKYAFAKDDAEKKVAEFLAKHDLKSDKKADDKKADDKKADDKKAVDKKVDEKKVG